MTSGEVSVDTRSSTACFGDLPPTALRVLFAFYLSGLETLQKTTLGSIEDLRRLWEGVKVPCWHRSCSIPSLSCD